MGLRCFITALMLVFTVQSVFALKLDEKVPNFEAEIFTYTTSKAEAIKFYDWIDEMDSKYAIIFSHPKEFSPVISEVERLLPEFELLGAKVIGLSVNSINDHQEWAVNVGLEATFTGSILSFPIIGDDDLRVEKLLDILPESIDSWRDITVKQEDAIRSFFIIGKDKKLKFSMRYPVNVDKDFAKVVQSIKLILSSYQRYNGDL